MEIHPRYVGSALVSDLNRIQGLMLGYVPWWLKDLDLRGGPPDPGIHGGVSLNGGKTTISDSKC